MRIKLLGFGLVVLVIVGVQFVPSATPSPPRPSTTAALPLLPQVSASPAQAPALDHEDDYSGTVEDLVGHVEHLDFDRLPEKTRIGIEVEIARRDGLKDVLWATYGPVLAADRRQMPVMPEPLRALTLNEFTYVLFAARTQQLAVAVSGSQTLASAQATPAVGPQNPAVTETVTLGSDPNRPCVTVALEGDPFGRRFSARAPASNDGPVDVRIFRDVTVEVEGQAACMGGPLAFSDLAARGLAVLR